MKYNNVEFIKQVTNGTNTVFTVRYDKGKDTYESTVPLKMQTEVAPSEVEEDIQATIDAKSPVETMKLLKEYYNTSEQGLMNKLQEQAITFNQEKKIEKKPYAERQIDPNTQYLSAFGWEYNKNQNIASLQVILRNKKTDEITTMLYKYPKGGFDPELPPYLTLYDIRQDIYHLRDAKQYEKANDYFRKIFKKDPITGQDVN